MFAGRLCCTSSKFITSVLYDRLYKLCTSVNVVSDLLLDLFIFFSTVAAYMANKVVYITSALLSTAGVKSTHVRITHEQSNSDKMHLTAVACNK